MGDKSGSHRAIDVILAATVDGVLAVDEHNVVRYCNRAAEELLGQPAGSLTGRRFGFELVPDGAGELEVTLPGDARRVLDLRVSATDVNGVPLRVASVRDVTHRKQAEQELVIALERQGAALALAEQLMGPLAEIDALARVLADDQITLDPADRLTVATRVTDEAARLQFLVSRVLTSAQVEPRAPNPARGRAQLTAAISEPTLAASRTRAEGPVPSRPAGPGPLLGHEPGLTIRERQVLDLMGQGLDPATIAERLVVSVHTARGHVKNVMMKLGAHTQLEAVVTATRLGLLVVPDGPSSLAR